LQELCGCWRKFVERLRLFILAIPLVFDVVDEVESHVELDYNVSPGQYKEQIILSS
jgi:hypothetical protein